MHDPEVLRTLAIPIARDAGALLMDGLRQTHTIHTKVSSTDLVSQFDRAAEVLITGRLHTVCPLDAILSEEGTQIEGTSGVQWVCDPLDGTGNFVRRRHPFVVSLAALIEDKVQAAVVFDPWLNELYEAFLGGGARMNGETLRCSSSRSLDSSAIATAFGRTAQDRVRQAAVLRKIIAHVGDIRRTGAAVYDICSVAVNRSDGYFYEGLKPWDLYAASLIASEAGARVSNFEGAAARPGEPMLAAAPEIADALLDLLIPASNEQIVHLDKQNQVH